MKNKKRCLWAERAGELDKQYHDEQWGRPEHNERNLFEMLILEGMQAGLTWSLILKKRENFRKAFDNFNPEKIAGYDAKKIKSLLSDSGIIRNRLKINAAVTNAKAYLALKKQYGGLDKFLWSYVDFKTIQNKWKTIRQIPAKTELSGRISKDLKKLGFKFTGNTIIYAYMQAIGMVNDHTADCFIYKAVNSKQ